MAVEVDRIVVRTVRVECQGGVSGRILKMASPATALAFFTEKLADPASYMPAAVAETWARFRIARVGAETFLADQEATAERWRAWWPFAERSNEATEDARARRMQRLAATADAYVKACARRERAPNEAVAALQGRRSSSRVRDDLKAAREEGILTKPGRRGVTGGVLTPKGAAILKEGTES
jgi:hypothetical protein